MPTITALGEAVALHPGARRLSGISWPYWTACLQPQPAFLRALRATLLRAWEEQRGEAPTQAAVMRARAVDLRQRKERLVEAYVCRQAIDRETYEQQLARINEGLALAELDRHEAESEALDVEGLLNYAEHLALNAGRMWKAFSHAQRLELQGFIFPEGVTWTRAGFGTAVTGLFFKEMRPVLDAQDVLATLAGFEPAIFTLKG